MQELDNTTAHSKFLKKICKTSVRCQKFLLEAGFTDSTLKFKDLELNLKVFCKFLFDIYAWFNNAVFLFSNLLVYEFKGSLFILHSLYYHPSNVNFINNIVTVPGKGNW